MIIDKHSIGCELVIGLVAPVGVDLEKIKVKFDNYFKQYNYKQNFVHLSRVVEELRNSDTSKTEHDRLNAAMEAGNSIRKDSERGDFLALLAINEISKKRSGEQPEPISRCVHVIRSLKHPDEVDTLRAVYRDGFFLVGVSASTKTKKRFLEDEKGISPQKVEKLIERDDKEFHSFGQSTRDVFQLADAFLTCDDDAALTAQVSRTLDLLFSKPVVPPTCEEYAMFMAYAASLRSADLSRQVGAVLTSETSDIISSGANDVPKYGGGLYWPNIYNDNNFSDERDYIKGFDSNEKQKKQLVLNIMKKFRSDTGDEQLIEEGNKLLKDTGILDITEYGRAVHAEMEALISAGRNGVSTVGATMYTTTYPCHNCAKHIVAAGVERVIYIEPYPKSFALKLHDDSINTDDVDNVKNRVIFQPFVGIGPRKFIDLFSMNLGSGRKIKRKQNGELNKWERSDAELRVPMTVLSYLDAEAILVKELDLLIQAMEANYDR